MLSQKSSLPIPSYKVLPISAALRNDKPSYRRNDSIGRVPAQAKGRSLNISPPTSDVGLPPSLSNNAATLDTLSQQDALALLSIASFGFALFAGDLVLWHKLRWLDQGVHLFVQDNISGPISQFARHGLSNTPIVLGITGWVAATVARANAQLLDKEGGTTGKAVRHFAIASTLYAWGGGAVFHGDVWPVDVLKHIFQRARPNELLTSFSFPSGHATGSTFIIGTLLYVILPVLMSETRSVFRREASDWLREWRLMIWSVGIAVTSSGRVLADVHWTSDVLAGACLGSGLVAVTVLLCTASDALVESLNAKKNI